MTCGNRSREKVKGYTLKDGEINKVVYVNDYEQMIEDMKKILKNAEESIEIIGSQHLERIKKHSKKSVS